MMQVYKFMQKKSKIIKVIPTYEFFKNNVIGQSILYVYVPYAWR